MQSMNDKQQERKPYDPPAVVYEATLDARAGSPTGLPNPLDLFGLEK